MYKIIMVIETIQSLQRTLYGFDNDTIDLIELSYDALESLRNKLIDTVNKGA
jgi:hypothetical protein